ncbi:MAG: hypothetical protein D6762_07845 [Candidatus Neomarinimicrobiota bacterium]|nr:MAG: hypothetical protein D6762_07845 [Candidatus Neomarinimicrobiota bacterium]
MTPSPVFALEEQFTALEQQIQLFPTDRLSLFHLIRFFSQPEANRNPTKFSSYYLESLEWFQQLLHPDTLQYHPPAFYEHLIQLLGQACSGTSGSPVSAEYELLKKTVQEYQIRLWLFLGELDRVARILGLPEPEILPTDVGPYERLRHWMDSVKRSGSSPEGPVPPVLERCDQDWAAHNHQQRDVIWVLLINQWEDQGLPVVEPEAFSLSCIQPLSVTTELLSPENGDHEVIFLNPTFSVQDVVFQQSRDAVRTAQSVFPRSVFQKKTWIKAVFSFPESSSRYTGDSMGLGMGLVALGSFSKVLSSYWEYRLWQNVAVTGAMSDTGTIKPVSPESLRLKLTAAFFSPMRAVVIPDQNRLEAQTFLTRMNRKYPYRALELITAGHFRDVIQRSAIVVKQSVPWARRLKIFSQNWLTIAATLLLAVAAVVYLPVWDRNPYQIFTTSNGLVVKNRDERRLWDYPVDFSLYPRMIVESNIYWPQTSLVTDLDGDGINEVLTHLIDPRNGKPPESIYCFDSHGTIRWKRDFSWTLRFGDELFEPNFYTSKIFVSTDTRESPYLFVQMRHRPWYPVLITKMNVQGEILETYIHSGVVHCRYLPERRLLVFYGTNNDYNSAVLGLLDPDHIAGHSPQDQYQYTPQGIPLADHVLYLRFPLVTSIFPYRGRYDVYSMEVLDNTGYRIDVRFEGWGGVIYLLDKNFRIVKVDFTDMLLNTYLSDMHHSLFEDFSETEVRRAFSRLEYWRQGKWVSDPGDLDPKYDPVPLPTSRKSR